MQTVNALTIRNHLGSVLGSLMRSGKPILVSKGRKISAVLITLEDFERRFLDVQAEEKRQEILKAIDRVKAKKVKNKSSLSVLRELRGYPN